MNDRKEIPCYKLFWIRTALAVEVESFMLIEVHFWAVALKCLPRYIMLCHQEQTGLDIRKLADLCQLTLFENAVCSCCLLA